MAEQARRYRGRLEIEIVLAFVAACAAFVLAALAGTAARSHVPSVALGIIFLIAILAAAHYAGVLYALPIAVAVINAFDWYFLPPIRHVDWATVLLLAIFLFVAVLVGAVATLAGRRAAVSEDARGMLAEEQAALRRVATLVARGAPPDDVFAAVAAELGRALEVDASCVFRYEPDSTATIVAMWGEDRGAPFGSDVTARVFRTGRSARTDDDDRVPGEVADISAVAAPIVIDDRLWGAAVAGSRSTPLPADAEGRIANFADLIAIAISNAKARTELAASRARVVGAADETRRRLERDLHDGIQQRLVSLALRMRATETQSPSPELSLIADDLVAALDEIREISRGIHPAILSEGGLVPALKALARRSAIPIQLDLKLDTRLDEPLEAAAYYVASEALTNAVKHAEASVVELQVQCRDGVLELSVRDDGVGGADPGRGSGIIGLVDRVEALGGTISVVSPAGDGTLVQVRLPAETASAPASGVALEEPAVLRRAPDD